MGLTGKFRVSRKLIVIVGSITVLCGGTGAAAVFIGADTLLGPSYRDINGLECVAVKTVQIKKKDRFWVRKFITTEAADGPTRVRTALRVASAVYETQKPDLVQVVVLDRNGPADRADMRGRAVGADVVFIPDPSKVPEEASPSRWTARYVDNLANGSGQFYGQRIVMPEPEIAALSNRLNDRTDCIVPEVEGAEGHGAPSGHGEKAGGHGEKAGGHGEDAGGHGEASGHGGEADAHGDAAPAEGGHGEAAGGHGEAVVEPAEGAHGEGSGVGWFASIKSMVLGSDEGATAEPAASAGHGEAAGGHGEASGHGEAAGHGGEADAHGDAAPAEGGHGEAAGGHGEAVVEPAESAHGEASGGGWFASIKSMVLGSDEGAAAEPAAHDGPAEAQAHAQPAAHTPSAEEGGHASESEAPAGHDAVAHEPAAADASAHETPVHEPSADQVSAHEPSAHETPAHEAVVEAPAGEASGEHAVTEAPVADAPAHDQAHQAAEPVSGEAEATHGSSEAAHGSAEPAVHGEGTPSVDEAVHAEAPASDAAPAEEAKSEGDAPKDWVSSLKGLVWGAEEESAPPVIEASVPEAPKAGDHADADAAGAAWLAKLKSKGESATTSEASAEAPAGH